MNWMKLFALALSIGFAAPSFADSISGGSLHGGHGGMAMGGGGVVESIQGDGDVLTTGDAVSIDGGTGITTSVVGDVLTIAGHIATQNTNAQTICATATDVLQGDGSCVANSGGAPGVDSIGTSELDDDAETPLSGEWLQVDSDDQAGISYRTDAEALADIGAQVSSSQLTEVAALSCSTGEIMEHDATDWKCIATPGGGGDLSAANSPNSGEWAKFTGGTTVEGRTDSEFFADLSLEIGVDLQAHDADTAKLDVTETIAANWVNTANPWADDEVANDITIDLATLATNVTTNANLTGPVTSTGNATAIATDAITDAMVVDTVEAGNAATVTTNANLTGPVTSSGNATAIATDAITDAMVVDTVEAGNAATVTTNANLTGPVTSSGNATAIATDAITDAMVVDGLTITNLSGTNTGDAEIGAGTAVMGTSSIAANVCATVVTVSATGVATTDVISAGFNGDPTAVTGYGVASADGLVIYPYPTANNVNFKVCNGTDTAIVPGALTLNWRVDR